ncbi:MAG: TetR/AcrR family transcriptional regulator [Minisyncoccia bacterium]
MSTKEKILNTASALFGEYGYFGASMSDIAKKINITKTTLYYYFKSKRDLYKKIIEHAFKNLELHLQEVEKIKNPTKKISKLIEKYLEFCAKEKNILLSLVTNFPKKDTEIKFHIKKLKENLNKDIANFLKDSFKVYKENQIDIKTLTNTLTEIMNGKVLESSFLNSKENLKKSAKKITEILFR